MFCVLVCDIASVLETLDNLKQVWKMTRTHWFYFLQNESVEELERKLMFVNVGTEELDG